MNVNPITVAYPLPELPQIPDRTFHITEYGAEAGVLSLCTSAIQAALDACAAAGGGTVIIPQGIWRTGPLTMHSRTNLHAQGERWYSLSRTRFCTRCSPPTMRVHPAGAASHRLMVRV